MIRALGKRKWVRRLAAGSVSWAKDNLPRSLQQRVPARLRRAARQVLQSGKSRALALDDKLWGGYSQSALKDLGRLADDEGASPAQRFEACYSLARWQAVSKNYEDALAYLRRAGAIAPWRTGFKRHYMLEALFLCHLGQTAQARELVVERSGSDRSFDASVNLLLANSWNADFGPQDDLEAEDKALAHINAIYRHFGLSLLRKIDAAQPLSMDNIEGVDVAPVDDPARAVTVIVPAYNGQETIETTLRGLAQQSWRALQVIVVDDCSTDATCSLVERFCQRDSRFRLLRKQENSGSYGSRNLALKEVTTPFITIHDADDWSHPQKIECQMNHLASTGAPYNYTMWVRATPALGFVADSRPYHRLLTPDHSAGLFPTHSVREAGAWDLARISADTELFWRLEALNGTTREHSRGRRVMVECPLAFGRQSETSLTRVGATHSLTMFHGVRREYREAADFWHRTLVTIEGAEPPFFPAPGIIRPGGGNAPQHDLLLITDFNAANSSAESAIAGAIAATDAALNVALLHYPAYHRDVTRPLRQDLRQHARDRNIRIVAPGETVETQLCLFHEIGLLQHALDRFPQISAGKTALIGNRLPRSDGDNPFGQFDLERVSRHAAHLFGAMPQLLPIAPLARSEFEASDAFPAISSQNWFGLLDASSRGENAPQWRGAARRKPVLGSLGNNDAPGWLQDDMEMRAAYCAGQDCHVHLMGGADFAGEKLARMPRNWRDLTGTGTSVTDFFADLDIFVYFPGARHSDALGYPIALAMNAGIPVIADPRFQENFGDAALYASPNEVWSQVQTLWNDASHWQGYSQAGRRFVATYLSAQAYIDRLCYHGVTLPKQLTN